MCAHVAMRKLSLETTPDSVTDVNGRLLVGRVQPKGSAVASVVAPPQRRKQYKKRDSRSRRTKHAAFGIQRFLSTAARSKFGGVMRENQTSQGH